MNKKKILLKRSRLSVLFAKKYASLLARHLRKGRWIAFDPFYINNQKEQELK